MNHDCGVGEGGRVHGRRHELVVGVAVGNGVAEEVMRAGRNAPKMSLGRVQVWRNVDSDDGRGQVRP